MNPAVFSVAKVYRVASPVPVRTESSAPRHGRERIVWIGFFVTVAVGLLTLLLLAMQE
jgi:hypothetical protein